MPVSVCAESRVALVTGGGVRVGAQISATLARAGFRVAVNYHRSAAAAAEIVETLQAQGYTAQAHQADITDRSGAKRLVAEVIESHGRIDVLVNNAALFERRAFEDLDEQVWERHLALNLGAPYRLSRLVAPAMLERGSGRIINIGGTIGIQPLGEYVPYYVAKSGLDALTRCLAAALAPTVQVNGVAPGAILFPDGTPRAEQRAVVRRVPAGRVGNPADVAEAVLFFAQAPDYITGAILPVDGGASLAGT